ncbi:MAG: hypothetical protein ACLT46_11315 [Hungatella sp.]
MAENAYPEAMAAFAAVIEEDSNYQEAQIMAEKAKEVYKADILKQAEEALEQGEYETAFEILYSGMEVLGDAAQYTYFQEDQLHQLWLRCYNYENQDPEYGLEEDISSADRIISDGTARKLSQEKFEQVNGMYDQLNWTPIITEQLNDTSDWEDDTYVIHVDSKKSVEDTIAQLDQLIQEPLERS